MSDQAAAVPTPAPLVEIVYQGHTYQVPVLSRLQLDPLAGEPDEARHDHQLACSRHDNLEPAVFTYWIAARKVILLTCAMCGAIVGAIRPTTEG
jgi:hypothetical protein